jgi:hypothetical protein
LSDADWLGALRVPFDLLNPPKSMWPSFEWIGGVH